MFFNQDYRHLRAQVAAGDEKTPYAAPRRKSTAEGRFAGSAEESAGAHRPDCCVMGGFVKNLHAGLQKNLQDGSPGQRDKTRKPQGQTYEG